MAIRESKIDVGKIAGLNELSFSKVTEESEPTGNLTTTTNTTNATTTVSSTKTITSPSKPVITSVNKPTNKEEESIFSKIVPTIKSPVDKAIGMFKFDSTTNTDCNNKPSKYKLTDGYNSNNRRMSYGNKTKCNNTYSLMDGILSNTKNFDFGSSILKIKDEAKIDNAIKHGVKNMAGGYGSSVNIGSLGANIKSGMMSNLAQGGLTAKAKSALGMVTHLCNPSNSSSMFSSSLFNFDFFKSLFDDIKCDIPGALLGIVQDLLGVDGLDKGSLLSAAVDTIMGDDKGNSLSNLGILDSFGDSVSSVALYTSDKFGGLLDSISSDESDVKDPTESESSLFDTLYTLKPNWDTDSLGNINYSAVANNDTVVAICKAGLTHKEPELDFSGRVITHEDSSSSIVITSSFA